MRSITLMGTAAVVLSATTLLAGLLPISLRRKRMQLTKTISESVEKVRASADRPQGDLRN
jgi:hypothetical protein